MRFRPWLLIPTAAYLALVGWITLGPQPYGDTGSGLLRRALALFSQSPATEWLTFSRVEGLANVALFVPLGLLLALALPRRAAVVAVIACVGLSAGIEAFQGAYLPTRVDDVRDIVHNGLGGLIGAALATAARLAVAPSGRLLRRA